MTQDVRKTFIKFNKKYQTKGILLDKSLKNSKQNYIIRKIEKSILNVWLLKRMTIMKDFLSNLDVQKNLP